MQISIKPIDLTYLAAFTVSPNAEIEASFQQ